MTAWDFICLFMPIASREKPGHMASRSEIKRWCQQKAVYFNGEVVEWNAEINFNISSLVLFPKSQRWKTTLW